MTAFRALLCATMLAAVAACVPSAQASGTSDTYYLTRYTGPAAFPYPVSKAQEALHGPGFEMVPDDSSLVASYSVLAGPGTSTSTAVTAGDAFDLGAGSYRLFVEVTGYWAYADVPETPPLFGAPCGFRVEVSVYDMSQSNSGFIDPSTGCFPMTRILAPGIYELAGTFDHSAWGLSVTTDHEIVVGASSEYVPLTPGAIRLFGDATHVPFVQFDGMAVPI